MLSTLPQNRSQEAIIEYLKNGLKGGKCYFKSKYIARDLGMTSKEVGTNMKMLSDDCADLMIEKWSYSKSTTWKVGSRSRAPAYRNTLANA